MKMRVDVTFDEKNCNLTIAHTVDGRNPAPPWMVETLKTVG